MTESLFQAGIPFADEQNEDRIHVLGVFAGVFAAPIGRALHMYDIAEAALAS